MGAVFTVLRVLVAAHGHVDGLVLAGSQYVSRTSYTRRLPIMSNSGYDGQFYYRLALGPLDWSRTAFGIRLDTLGRLDRIAYPAIVWVLSAGRPAAVPVMMVVVNVLMLGVLAGLGAALSRQAGRHLLWGLPLAGFWGFLWTLSRDLTELTEAVFLVAGLLALRKDKPVLAGVLFSVAVLAREPALLVVAAVFLSRMWVLSRSARARVTARAADATWLLPVVVFAAWQVALRVGTGTFPALTSGGNNSGLPFVGLVDGIAHHVEEVPKTAGLLAIGELGVLAVVTTLAVLSLRTTTAALHERIAWLALAALAVTLTKGIWVGDVGFRSLDDFYLLSGLLMLFSKLRLDLAGLVVAGAWCVVAVELVLFI